jgi:vancomycin resistance protein YoaR
VATVSGDVPAGTSVQGVDIGGMSTEQAAATLELELGDTVNAPIPVTAGEAQAELDPQEAGLAVDWEATAAQSSGVILRPGALLAHLRGQVELDLITTLDEDALVASLDDLAAEAAVEPVEPRIRYTKEGDPRLREAVDGATLDVDASAEVVAAAYLQPVATPLVLPMEPIPTVIPAEEAQRVFTEVAQPAVALPVTLVVGNKSTEIPGEDIAASLTFTATGSTFEPELNARKLHRLLADDELANIERAGRDARFIIRDGRPVIIPSRKGRAVDTDELGTAVMAVLAQTTAATRTASVSLVKAPADFTTAEARALNITEKLSSFRQDFVPAEYRYINVGEAARRINGTVLEPGETFSMNDTAKERTPANGYTEGYIISGGRFREELGGGVSIITTAMWTAGFYAGLERVEQHPHGLYIPRYTAGLEATVAWGLLDLKMRNETGNGVLITATRFSDGVLIEMWGTKRWDQVTATFSPRTNYTDYETIVDDGDKCVPSSGLQGFSINVTRKRIKDGKSESTETFYTTYKPTPNVVCQ